MLRIGAAQMVVTPNELDPADRRPVPRADDGRRAHAGSSGSGTTRSATRCRPRSSCPAASSAGSIALIDINQCPFYRDFYSQLPPQGRIGICDTIFQNNIGPGADTVLQGEIGALLDQANP